MHHVQITKCTIISLDSSLIFCQECDTKLDDDVVKLTVKTLCGSTSLSQPWLYRLHLGTLPKCTEATAAQHPEAHQG